MFTLKTAKIFMYFLIPISIVLPFVLKIGQLKKENIFEKKQVEALIDLSNKIRSLNLEKNINLNLLDKSEENEELKEQLQQDYKEIIF